MDKRIYFVERGDHSPLGIPRKNECSRIIGKDLSE